MEKELKNDRLRRGRGRGRGVTERRGKEIEGAIDQEEEEEEKEEDREESKRN